MTSQSGIAGVRAAMDGIAGVPPALSAKREMFVGYECAAEALRARRPRSLKATA